MHIKIKQSVFSSKYGMLDTNRVLEVDNNTGKDFVKAGFAETFEPEVKEDKKQTKRTVKKETPKVEEGVE